MSNIIQRHAPTSSRRSDQIPGAQLTQIIKSDQISNARSWKALKNFRTRPLVLVCIVIFFVWSTAGPTSHTMRDKVLADNVEPSDVQKVSMMFHVVLFY